MTTDSYELPPLPEPDDTDGYTYAGHSDDQMREYALLAVKAERERCAQECERIAWELETKQRSAHAAISQECANTIRGA